MKGYRAPLWLKIPRLWLDVRNPAMAAAWLGPLAMMLLVRYAWPFLAAWLEDAFRVDLDAYRELAAVSLLQAIPLLAGAMSGFTLLDERDEGVVAYYSVTPLSRRGYYASRLLPTTAAALLLSLAFPAVAGFTAGDSWSTAAALLANALLTPLLGLALAALAANKVEGLALSKALGVLFFVPALVAFAPYPWGWLAAPAPSFWMTLLYLAPDPEAARYAGPETAAAAAFALEGLLFWLLYRRYARRLD